MTIKSLQDTIVALSTPVGEGAIAMIRLTGRQSFDLTSKFFQGKDINTSTPHTLHFGKWIVNGSFVDEVVLGLYRGPNSYTGEDVIEISCHGSPFIIQKIISSLTDAGASLAGPGEFTLRAFLNGKMDLAQAEAVADLIASESEAAHDLALNQMKGGISNEIKKLRDQLIEFASLIELELDFGEEDVEFANRDRLSELLTETRSVISGLLNSFKLGNVIKKGVPTVIAGKPNAGKSTLLNVLLEEERAIVSDIPGTTRDTIEEVLNINGILFRLIDTAGLRESTDTIESIGIERTLAKMAQAALIIYIFDVIEVSPENLWETVKPMLEEHPEDKFLFLANKMDLNPYTKPESYYHNDMISKGNLIPLSAKNKMNVEFLKEKLFEMVVGGKTIPDQTLLSNQRHVEAFQKAQQSLGDVLAGMEQVISSDFLALDIRQALHHLGSVTGEISTDDLLDSIFRNFCIGK